MPRSSDTSQPHSPAGFAALESLLHRTLPFTSYDGRAFVRVPADSPPGCRTHPVRSRALREWFFARSFFEFQTVPTAHAFTAILRHLESLAAADPDNRRIHVPRRVDSRSQTILLDLANSEGQFVEISATGWQVRVGEGPPFETSLPNTSLPTPEPAAQDAPLQLLRSTLNLGPANGPDWLRCFAWLLSTLHSRGPFPILILRGPSGCGKSVAARALRALVDPCTSPLTPLPSSPRQLLQLARDNWILAFDHVSSLAPQVSDTLCRLAGGAGIACCESGHREPVQLWIKRPVLLTVTPAFTPSPDLVARSLSVTLPGLTAATRRSEQAVLTAIDQSLARILGALCDAVSAILRAPVTVSPHSTRHTSALAGAVAAAPSLGCTEDDVRRAFEVPPPPAPLLEALRAIFHQSSRWTGTATDLAALLRLSLNPKALSERLRKHRLTLAESGIEIVFRRLHGGARIIELCASPGFLARAQSQAPQPLTTAPEIVPVSVPCVTRAPARSHSPPQDRQSRHLLP